jgi:hypothetical protein
MTKVVFIWKFAIGSTKHILFPEIVQKCSLNVLCGCVELIGMLKKQKHDCFLFFQIVLMSAYVPKIVMGRVNFNR